MVPKTHLLASNVGNHTGLLSVPGTPKVQLEEALHNPRAGPRPISLDEYRARRKVPKEPVVPAPTPADQPTKYRTGVEAKFRRAIEEVRRRLLTAVGKEERLRVSRELQRIHSERLKYRREKKRKQQTNSVGKK